MNFNEILNIIKPKKRKLKKLNDKNKIFKKCKLYTSIINVKIYKILGYLDLQKDYYYGNLFYKAKLSFFPPISYNIRIIKNTLVECLEYKLHPMVTLEEYITKCEDRNDIKSKLYESMHLVKRLHDMGIRHNDLSLSNIVVYNNELYLIDFEDARRNFFRFHVYKEVVRYLNSIYLNKMKNDNIDVRLSELFNLYLYQKKMFPFTKLMLKKYMFKYFRKKYSEDMIKKELAGVK